MTPQARCHGGERWYRQLPPRLAPYRNLKRAVIAVFVPMFFVGYFAALQHPLGPITTMPLTPIDRVVGFAPSALILYVSLWLYIPLAPALLTCSRDLVAFVATATAIAMIGLVLFMVWPTQSPTLPIDSNAHPMFRLLRGTDHGRNACPSLHAAFAVFTALWLDRILRQISGAALGRLANATWCLGVLYSTLATKQHVFVDTLGGTALALIVVGSERWMSAWRAAPKA